MSTGLAPWTYRKRLDGAPDPFQATTTLGSTAVDLQAPSPLIGVALHASSRVRDELLDRMAIGEHGRCQEEDPGTHRFLTRLPHVLIARQSRYEVDLNRPPDTAIYTTPELAWGVDVWDQLPTREQREASLERWYEFHAMVDAAVEHAIDRFGRAVVLDMHSYNYQRDAPVDWRTDGKPVINVGTGHLILDDEGAQLKDRFLAGLEATTVLGEEALVQENAVFQGGYLNRRLSRTYGPRCLTFSVEYKKVFMDPEAQRIDEKVLEDLIDQFEGVAEGLAGELGTELLEERRPLPEP